MLYINKLNQFFISLYVVKALSMLCVLSKLPLLAKIGTGLHERKKNIFLKASKMDIQTIFRGPELPEEIERELAIARMGALEQCLQQTSRISEPEISNRMVLYKIEEEH